jgi:hypothetical protein
MKTTGILSSRDYSVFKILKGNRKIVDLHVMELADSMKKEGYWRTFPIVVVYFKGIGYIKAGQHRYRAAAQARVEYCYIVDNTKYASLDEIIDSIRKENLLTKKWRPEDVLQSFVDRGFKEYIALQKYMNKNLFEIGHALRIMQAYDPASGEFVGYKTSVAAPGYYQSREDDFNNGTLNFVEFASQYEAKAQEISDIRNAHGDYKSFNDKKKFIYACVRFTTLKYYIHTDFMKNLKKLPSWVGDFANSIEYVNMFEKILGWHELESKNQKIKKVKIAAKRKKAR